MSVKPTVFPGVKQELPTFIKLRCPHCGSNFGSPRYLQTETCDTCHFNLQFRDGIWNALPPTREQHYRQFIADYQNVRSREGRGSSNANYYLALPFKDLSGRNQDQWAIRARTFTFLEKHILPRMLQGGGRSLKVLDLGAGNCWLSYRLSLLGHRPVAVDLVTNDLDGLGAAKSYADLLGSMFPCFRSELDRLPFADSQFDCAIFNASFHYSENYVRTLGEAIRCVRPRGSVIIADTAWYRREESGRQMIEERRTRFQQEHGLRSDSIESLEYLTPLRLKALERQFGFRWNVHRPFYGLRWHMRPFVAALRRRRAPSRFRIYVAEIAK